MTQPSHPGRLVAIAAVLVSAPRLTLAFLVGDGVDLPQSVHVALLALSSVATAAAVTGGAAYLAHAAVKANTGRRTLGLVWLAALLASSALMAPLIVEGLARSPLAATLDTPAIRWAWAVCAVLAVDLVAAGAMRAEAGASRDREDLERREREHPLAIADLIAQRNRASQPAADASSPLASTVLQPEVASTAAPPGLPPSQRVRRDQPRRAAQARTGETQRDLTCLCNRAFTSQQALAGHQRWCAVARGTGSSQSSAADPAPTPTESAAPHPLEGRGAP